MRIIHQGSKGKLSKIPLLETGYMAAILISVEIIKKVKNLSCKIGGVHICAERSEAHQSRKMRFTAFSTSYKSVPP